MPDELIDNDGWFTSAREVRSPNFNARPFGTKVTLMVIHNISLPPGRFGGTYVEDFFCNRLVGVDHHYFGEIAGQRVSAHMFIDRKGRMCQFVSFNDRAWHAGDSSFAGKSNCNDYSIGIELEGTDERAYTRAQYKSLTKITRALMTVYPKITIDRIVGHSDIAPGRKTDPGGAFDWQRYRIGIESA